METRRCISCGKPIERKQNKLYCSRSCRNKHLTRKDMEEKPKYPKVCAVCGKEFLARRPNRKYCSDECNWKAQWEKQRKPKYPRPQGTLWKERRVQVCKAQKNKCWLCGERFSGCFDLHHLVHGDHSVESSSVVALCKKCHNHIHRVMVTANPDGTLSFHGAAIDLLIGKGYKMP